MSKNSDFTIGSKVVYPSHGVGRIISETSEVIAGLELNFYVIDFSEDKLTIRVPLNKVESSGLRLLSSSSIISKALNVLKGRARPGRGMWSRRAKEYEDKINSGSIISTSEVIRDLHKNVDDPDRSYSERIIYELALSRLAREFAAVNDSSIEESIIDLEKVLMSRRLSVNPVEEESAIETENEDNSSFDVFLPDKVA